MNPAKNRERKCSTCKHYQPSPLWRKGWCRNPLLYDRNTNHLVEADSLACNRTFIDYWEPITGPTPKVGPQPHNSGSKPRIAPSIPMDTMDAQGKRTTAAGTGAGNTPVAGMAALLPRQVERPSLALVTPDYDEDLVDDAPVTMQLEEIARGEEGARPVTGRQSRAGAVKNKNGNARRPALPAFLGSKRNRVLAIILGAVLLVALVGGFLVVNKGLLQKPKPVPTVAALSPKPSPTGFGDPTATVPPKPTSPPATQAQAPPTDHIGLNGWVQVTTQLNVRADPSTKGARLGSLPQGTKAHVVDGPKDADGFTWWKIDKYDPNNPAATGWCAAKFLTPTTAP